jgi:uncharacterized protein YndB with AHSA1/START domain
LKQELIMTIHQEVSIGATPQRVYNVLTNSAAFAKMTGGREANISQEPGGAVSLFGGDIQARNVELVPGERLVQAWRSRAWPEGVYSIVKFELSASGKGTKLIFDQAGHPADAQSMLEGGWQQMYWGPMEKMLSSG